MEPQAVVNLNNKLREYQIQEKREVERILWELSQKLMPYTNSLHQYHYVLARLDVVNAKALYAHELRATEPIIDANNYVALWQAWHPLLEREKAVANDIILGEEYQAIVITGPNTGGKTILLKTGLFIINLPYLASRTNVACGFHLDARSPEAAA